MRFVTAEQMREIDRHAIVHMGIPSAALMENAGRAIAEEVLAFCRERRQQAGKWSRQWSVDQAAAERIYDDGWDIGVNKPLQAFGPDTRESGARHGDGGNAPIHQLARAGQSGVRMGGSIRGDVRRHGKSAFGGSEPPFGPVCPNAGGFGELGATDGYPEHWLILVGKGNNGGDGLVCARHLADAGVRVSLVYAEAPEKLGGEAALQQRIAEALGLAGAVYAPGAVASARSRGVTGIVDALLGTGAKGAPRGAYASLIREANESGLPIVAADIPSGLDADTGEAHDPCIRARITVCLAFLKAGLTQYPAAKMAGDVIVRYIGIPRELPQGVEAAGFVLAEETLRGELGVDPGLRREADGHKGTYGHVLLAAGSLPLSGAGLLAAKAALRAGCGLATWALPAALLPHVLGAVPELMLAPAASGDAGAWNAAAAGEVLRLLAARDVLAVGPGLGRFPGEDAFLRALWEGAQRPLVVDADALNILAAAGGLAAWKRRDAATVLTPHPGEMARLAGLATAEVQRDRIGLARRFALQHGVTLVLKGARTVVAAPDGRVFVGVTGHPGMATGGSGDVLTGIIAGLLAQGLDAVQAAALGVHLHGLAGERAAAARPGYPASLLAGDIIEAL
ncbi:MULTISPECIES: NAD(P)H-hydrate dehydratase [Paenibacillus]|uniref:NAD(P)H-hydrate dehydratase n=1 Tax=Paenibacillus TaxID=44249 RepID=UPI000ED00E06|nr:NAD(P)H-hydrate dehydratase [Paenibacillus macerans]GBK63602.1 bifunctional ADP-dependent NAD(P)H-hydrate dehydratase/NAD(P)H-hydrate epimerase [Paenibacillus macerans]GBK69915.1 bifunctional ADP-dependent NAD(P)H-hydrate dehydratase/NAD(P)H-hydrate epimerase [Paenibacillus macerans]